MRMVQEQRVIRAYKVFGRWRILPTDLALYLESVCNQPGDPHASPVPDPPAPA